MIEKLVFLCGARDFHAIDWYRSALQYQSELEVCILTDLISAEGFKKIVNENDRIFYLLILDKFLFNKQSELGNKWRNLLKIIVAPIQVILIRKFYRKNPNSIFYCHSMYYLFLAWLAKVPFLGTPQGSDILIKPNNSWLYKLFTIKSLRAAKIITVDSVSMQKVIKNIAGVNAYLVQNGIDISCIQGQIVLNNNNKREKVVSIRGLTELYRIENIIKSRNLADNNKVYITLVYPFYEMKYLENVKNLIKPEDEDLGRINRKELYNILSCTKLVISIPSSDSSPRSVYEAIFCGCAVAITYNNYYESLPSCMKSRIILVDLSDEKWFDKAIEEAKRIVQNEFIPSLDALNSFDQKKNFEIIKKLAISDGNK